MAIAPSFANFIDEEEKPPDLRDLEERLGLPPGTLSFENGQVRWLPKDQEDAPWMIPGRPEATPAGFMANLTTAPALALPGVPGAVANLADVYAQAAARGREPGGFELGLGALGAIPAMGAVRKVGAGKLARQLDELVEALAAQRRGVTNPEIAIEMRNILGRRATTPEVMGIAARLKPEGIEELASSLANEGVRAGNPRASIELGNLLGRTPTASELHSLSARIENLQRPAQAVTAAARQMEPEILSKFSPDVAEEVTQRIGKKETEQRVSQIIDMAMDDIEKRGGILQAARLGNAREDLLRTATSKVEPSLFDEPVDIGTKDPLYTRTGGDIAEPPNIPPGTPRWPNGFFHVNPPNLEDIKKATFESPFTYNMLKLTRSLVWWTANWEFSPLGIQGYLGWLHRPQELAGAVKVAGRAMLNHDVLLEAVNKNPELRDNALRDGVVLNVFKGGPETAADFELAEDLIGKVPVVGGHLREGAAAFNDFFTGLGDMLRLYWYDTSMKNRQITGQTLTTAQRKDLAEAVNNMTGTTNRAIRDPWAAIGFFAPRFVISELDVLTKAVTDFGPNAVGGDEIRQALLKTWGGALATTIAANQARGEETSFDPADPDFMKIRDVNGQNISLFGHFERPLRLMARLMLDMTNGVRRGKEPVSDVVGHVFDYYRSIGGPVVGALIDASFSETVVGEKIPKYDTDFFGFMGKMAETRFSPIIQRNIQQAAERYGGPEVVVTGGILGAGGARASLIGKHGIMRRFLKENDIRDADGKRITSPTKLAPKQYEVLERELRSEGKFAGVASEENKSAFAQEREKLYRRKLDVDKVLTDVRSQYKPGKTNRAYKDELDKWNSLKDTYYTQLQGIANTQKWIPEVAKAIENKKLDADNYQNALNRYYEFFSEERLVRTDDEVYNKIDAYLATLPEEERKYVEENVGINRTPLDEERFADLKKLRVYFDLEDAIKDKYDWDALKQLPPTSKLRETKQKAMDAAIQKLKKATRQRMYSRQRDLYNIGVKWLGWTDDPFRTGGSGAYRPGR